MFSTKYYDYNNKNQSYNDKITTMKNRQKELQDEFFEIEKAMSQLTLANDKEKQQQKDNKFTRCGALYKGNDFVCCRKINKSKGYIKFCGYHQNKHIVHVLDEYWDGYWMKKLTQKIK